jgi:tetratricopeptide (TPR) repeat protein
MHLEFADTYAAQGDVTSQEEAARKGLATMEDLVKAEPGRSDWQQDLAIAVTKTGDVMMATGRQADALAHYERSLSLLSPLAADDPASLVLQHRLAAAHERLANAQTMLERSQEALASYEHSRQIVERIAASDPANRAFQRDLAVAHNKVANALAGEGKQDLAVASYAKALEILKRLVDSDPANAGWQDDAAVTRWWMARARAKQGKHAEAIPALRESLVALGKVSAADPDNFDRLQHLAEATLDLAHSLTSTGDLDGALKMHQDNRDRLVAILADNAKTPIIQRLTARAIGGIADTQLARGEAAKALEAYGESLAILDLFAKAAPENTDRQRDLSEMHTKAGEAAKVAGNQSEALRHLEAGLAITERLAASDAANTEVRAELAAAYGRVGILLVEMEDVDKAKGYFLKARETLTTLLAKAPGTEVWQTYLEKIDKLLAAL